MAARQSKLSKARGKLQSKLRQLEPMQALLQQSLQREHDLIEARAQELTEWYREQADKSAEAGAHLQAEVLRHSCAADQWRHEALAHRDGIAYLERGLNRWRIAALALGAAAIILGGLLGNALL
ncbi:hypothetical protein D3C77_34500 [compost metagenome]